jgi:hypothetical protein
MANEILQVSAKQLLLLQAVERGDHETWCSARFATSSKLVDRGWVETRGLKECPVLTDRGRAILTAVL